MITHLEMVEVLNNYWATAKDIQKLSGYGINKCYTILKEIQNQIKKDGKKVLETKRKVVPMKRVIEYLELDENYIRSRARKEGNNDNRTLHIPRFNARCNTKMENQKENT